MSHLFAERGMTVYSLMNEPLVGNGDCVELVRRYSPYLRSFPASLWRQGKLVLDALAGGRTPTPGTVIATFYRGRYPCWPHGNHAAAAARPTKPENHAKQKTGDVK